MALTYVPILEDVPRPDGRHPMATRRIEAFEEIVCECQDCGHRRTFDRIALAEFDPTLTFGAFWRQASCSECQDAGGAGKTVLLEGRLRDTPIEDREPIYVERRRGALETLGDGWSEKRGRLRRAKDDLPPLPRRALFRDRP